MNCKACSKCGKVKALDAFHAAKHHSDGRASQCGSCHNAQTAARQKANPEKVRAKQRKWAKANPEKVRAKQRKWAKANPEKALGMTAAWRKANSEKLRAKERRGRQKLISGYVKKLLKVPGTEISPELLALKREQLETHRLAKQVKQHLKEITK
jgi:ABC-type nitrate/sulfonate/bicarbonate transport system substrate-binding protein